MQQIIQEVGKDVGDFMKEFGINYIAQLLNSKLQNLMNDTVDKVMPSAFQDDGGSSDGVDIKNDEDKTDDAPIAAGCALIGHRIAYGPDRAYHRYYDFAVWSIKPQDSVIGKVVRRHKPILDWVAAMKKTVANAPEFEFPQKKWFNKNVDYYTNRFVTMRTYFRSLTPVQDISTSEYFLKYWNLQYDATRAASREVFFAALQVTCESNNIDWNGARWRAQEIGLDMDETEMLKVVAIAKVGDAATQKIRDQVYALGYVPGPVKGRFISSAESKLAAMIATTVETAWGTVKDTFNKLADELNKALDQAMQPLSDLIGKILDPVGKIIKEKFDKLESKIEVDDGLNREIGASRFPPLVAALDNLSNGKAKDAADKLIESINKMNAAYQYVGYLRYNLGDPEIGQYIPFVNEIQENHYRLTIALTDIAYVFSRAGVYAFEPILRYIDKIGESGFDEKAHESEVQDAVREGGRRLAIDFFSLPQTVDRACWYCGRKTTTTVMEVGETTCWGIADLLGATVSAWKPTSKEDAKAKFIEVLKAPLDAFISDRVKTFVSAVRLSTANIIARQLFSVIGGAIDDIAKGLDELVKPLPKPISDNLKPGEIVKYLLDKMATNCVTLGVKKLAKKTEAIMYSQDGVAVELDQYEVNRYRWAPRIRDYDDDKVEPEGDETKKTAASGDDANANTNADSNANTDANATDNN